MKFKRRTELILGIGIILIIFVIIGFNVFKNTVDADQMLTDIREAGVKGDISYLKDHMEMVDGEALGDERIGEILELMEEEGLEFSLNTVKKLDEEEQGEGNLELIDPVVFKKDGRHRLFYNRYKLVFNYYDLILRTNLDDQPMEIYVDGSKVSNPIVKDGKIIVQHILPGRHEYELKFGEGLKNSKKGEFEALSFESIGRNYDLYSLSQDQGERFNFGIGLVEDLDVEARSVEVYSSLNQEYGDVYLFIDGEKTDKIINRESHMIGPIFEGDKQVIYGQMDVDGKTYKSREVDLSKDDSSYIDLEIKYEPAYKFTEEDMYELMDEYIYRLTEAINIGDFSHVAHTIDPDGPLYEMQRNLVNNLYEKNTEELVIGYEYLSDLKKINDSKYQVIIKEDHRVFEADKGAKEVTHTWLYTITIKNDRAYVNKLERP